MCRAVSIGAGFDAHALDGRRPNRPGPAANGKLFAVEFGYRASTPARSIPCGLPRLLAAHTIGRQAHPLRKDRSNLRHGVGKRPDCRGGPIFGEHNWPKDVKYTRLDPATGESTDITGEGFYDGRGKIIGIAGNNYTVREEKSYRLVEVGPDPEDVIRPLGFNYSTLTLGDLRAFLVEHKDAPDDIPVTVVLPLSFFSDLDEMPSDHPEYRAVSECQSVEACGVAVTGFTEHGDFTEHYIPLEKRGAEEWAFSVEITPHPEQCFEALRKYEDE